MDTIIELIMNGYTFPELEIVIRLLLFLIVINCIGVVAKSIFKGVR